MAILREDLFTRGRFRRHAQSISGLHCALVFVALALVVLARVEHPLSRSLQLQMSRTLAPFISEARLSIVPLAAAWERIHLLVAGSGELDALRKENARLRAVEKRVAQSKERYVALAKTARLVRDLASEEVISVGVLAGADGAFRRSLLIDAGRRDGIYDGYPVHGLGGLLGRTIDVTDDSARVLLFDDVNSRVPVHVGRDMHRAIVAGYGEGAPRLLYLKEAKAVAAGDLVTTSGAAGMLPAGLAIGKVVKTHDGLRVRLLADKGPYRFVAVQRFASPRDRLTGFLAAKAFERRMRERERNPRQASGPAERSLSGGGRNAQDGALLR